MNGKKAKEMRLAAQRVHIRLLGEEKIPRPKDRDEASAQLSRIYKQLKRNYRSP